MPTLPVANVTVEGVVLFLHVLAVVAAFGPTFAYGLFLATAMSTNQAAVPTVLRGVRKVDDALGWPGLAILLLSGVWLVSDGDLPWEWSDTFVSVGLLAIVVLAAMAFFFFRPRLRQGVEMAERDLSSGGQLSEEFQELAKRVAIGGHISTVIVLVALFFMTVKP